MATLYRTVVGAIGFFAVGMQYWLIVYDKTGPALVTSTVHFLSYFTILTNLLAATAMVLPLAMPNASLGRFFARPSVRTAIAGYIVIVGTVYYLLLRNLGHAQGWSLFLDHVLHYVLPPLFVVDWLLFVPKGEVEWRNGLACLGFPAVYAAWTLAHGAVTGWYPYPFLDVADLGYARTLMNIAGLVLAFLALDLALVGLARLLHRTSRK